MDGNAKHCRKGHFSVPVKKKDQGKDNFAHDVMLNKSEISKVHTTTSDDNQGKKKKKKESKICSKGAESKTVNKTETVKKLLTDINYDAIFQSVLMEETKDNEKGKNTYPRTKYDEDMESLASDLAVDDWNESDQFTQDKESPPLKKSSATVCTTFKVNKLAKIANKQSKLKPKQHGIPKSGSTEDLKTIKEINKPDTNSSKKIANKNAMHTLESEEEEETGTWICCSNSWCHKWRYVSDISDPVLVPENWKCKDNSDKEHNSCEKPEVQFDESEHIYTKFTVGSIVWAKMDGFPWWPAMVEHDPDYDTYFELQSENSMTPTQYHVTFLDDKISRAWIRASWISPYYEKLPPKTGASSRHPFKKEIEAAKKNADKAFSLNLQDRLKIYSFSSRFSGKSRSKASDTQPRKEKSKKAKGVKHHKKVEEIMEKAGSVTKELENALESFQDDSDSYSGSESSENYLPTATKSRHVPCTKQKRRKEKLEDVQQEEDVESPEKSTSKVSKTSSPTKTKHIFDPEVFTMEADTPPPLPFEKPDSFLSTVTVRIDDACDIVKNKKGTFQDAETKKQRKNKTTKSSKKNGEKFGRDHENLCPDNNEIVDCDEALAFGSQCREKMKKHTSVHKNSPKLAKVKEALSKEKKRKTEILSKDSHPLDKVDLSIGADEVRLVGTSEQENEKDNKVEKKVKLSRYKKKEMFVLKQEENVSDGKILKNARKEEEVSTKKKKKRSKSRNLEQSPDDSDKENQDPKEKIVSDKECRKDINTVYESDEEVQLKLKKKKRKISAESNRSSTEKIDTNESSFIGSDDKLASPCSGEKSCTKKKKKKHQFSVPHIKTPALQCDKSDRKVPNNSEDICSPAKNYDAINADQHVPDIEKSYEFENEDLDLVKLEKSGDKTLSSIEVQEKLTDEEISGSDLKNGMKKRNLKFSVESSDDEEELDLEVNYDSTKVVVEEIARAPDKILGRFSGKCCEHQTDSDDMDLIED